MLGFAGAPFTLACYLVEGRPAREFPRAKALMYGEPATWHALMEALTLVTIDYLRAQIAAGADAVQLFDSWLGLLDPVSYETMVLPYTRRIFAEVAPLAPTIHFSTGTAALLEQIAGSGCTAVSVDWRQPLDVAWGRLGSARGHPGESRSRAGCWRRGRPSSAAPATSWSGRVGEPGTFSISGMASCRRRDPETLARIVRLVHGDA